MNYKVIIGERIHYERQKLGLTQKELGSQLGVSEQCLSGWEHGRNMPDVVALRSMSRIFGISIEDFLAEAYYTKKESAKKKSLSPDLTEKELRIIAKIRALSPERRKAVEILLGIRDTLRSQ